MQNYYLKLTLQVSVLKKKAFFDEMACFFYKLSLRQALLVFFLGIVE